MSETIEDAAKSMSVFHKQFFSKPLSVSNDSIDLGRYSIKLSNGSSYGICDEVLIVEENFMRTKNGVNTFHKKLVTMHHRSIDAYKSMIDRYIDATMYSVHGPEYQEVQL